MFTQREGRNMNWVRQMKMIQSNRRKIAIRIEGDQKRNALSAWANLILRRSSWWKEHPPHDEQKSNTSHEEHRHGGRDQLGHLPHGIIHRL